MNWHTRELTSYIKFMSHKLGDMCLYLSWRIRMLYHEWVQCHDDFIKWKHFPHNWPFVRRHHRSPVNSPHKGQWRRALIFLMICACNNNWVNKWGAGDGRRHRAHYDVTVMLIETKDLWTLDCILHPTIMYHRYGLDDIIQRTEGISQYLFVLFFL